MLFWVGSVYDHLYAVMADGRTYRLDKDVNVDPVTNAGFYVRTWNLVATIPVEDKKKK